MNDEPLTDIQQFVLESVATLMEATPMNVWNNVKKIRPISVGTAYSTLTRLEQHFRYVRMHRQSEHVGGRQIVFYDLTESGKQVIAELASRKIFNNDLEKHVANGNS